MCRFVKCSPKGRNNRYTPYLFNAKELDEDTGLYYYGARYYDSRVNLWLSVYPIATYNPLEKENHIDGEHNKGIYNSFNHGIYSYCYQNPIKFVDPNGKQNKPAITYTFEAYVSLLEKTMNRELSDAEMKTLKRRCIGITMLGINKTSGNPPTYPGYSTFEDAKKRLKQWKKL